MHEFWQSVIAPLLAAGEPAAVVVAGPPDARLDELLADHAEAFHRLPADAGLAAALRDALAPGGTEPAIALVGAVDDPAGADRWEGGRRVDARGAVEEVRAALSADVEVVHVPGFGGLAVLVPGALAAGRRELLAAWRLPDGVRRHLAALEAARLLSGAAEHEARTAAEAATAAAASAGALPGTSRAEHEALRERIAELTAELARREAELRERDGWLEAQRAESRALAAAAEARAEERVRAPAPVAAVPAPERVVDEPPEAPAPVPSGDAGGAGRDGPPPPPATDSPSGRERVSVAALERRLDRLDALTTGALGGPLVLDPRGLVRPAAAARVELALRLGATADGARRCLVAAVRGATGPFAIALDDGDAGPEARAFARALAGELPVTLGAPSGAAAWVVEVDERARLVHGWDAALLAAAGAAPDAAALTAPAAGALPGWLPPPFAGLVADGPAEGPPLVTARRSGATGPTIALPALLATAADAPPPPAGWPAGPEALVRRLGPLRVVYVLPGVAEGGSGGSHSIVQEAAALTAAGAEATVLVGGRTIAAARAAYPEHAALLRELAGPEALAGALAGADVAVATEARSVAAVRAAAGDAVLVAYYVQDYEALFVDDEGPRSDEALLSYRAVDGPLMAKTDWLCNVVALAHEVPVAKVDPSLDTALFHPPAARAPAAGRPLRVAAMVRPRTPRRRPVATAALLRRAAAELGAHAVSFGCRDDELAAVAGAAHGLDHREVLARAEVADLLRWADVFVDLSVYQAFGRTGLEAMACGCVPVLPRRGGVGEFARDGVDALLADTGDPGAVLALLAGLDDDRARLEALSAAGAERARGWSAERAGASVHATLALAVRARREAV